MRIASLRAVPTAAALLFSALVVSSGCAKSGESGSAPVAVAGDAGAAAKPRQVLNIGNGSDPADLDPQTITGRPESDVTRALIEGLLNFHPQTLEPVPGVAERWELSADQRTYTFHLRADARWSNGDPVTSADFLASWQRMLSPALKSLYGYMLYVVEGAEDYREGRVTDFTKVGFSAPDARTVVIRLRRPTAYFLNLMLHYSWYPVHRPTVEKFGGWTKLTSPWTRVGNYVGNGAFVLKERRHGHSITVVKSPTYWNRDAVKLDEIRFLTTEDTGTEERMFRTGQLHITKTVPLSAVEGYRAMKPSPMRIDPMFGTMYIRANVKRPGLTDVRVRRALAIAIDREAITTRVNRTGKIPAYNYTPPGAGGFVARAKVEGTIEDARRLLAEAGHPDGRGLPPIEMLFSNSENARVLSEAIQERWRAQLGVNVKLLSQEWKVYLSTMDERKYDLALCIWSGDYLDPMTFLDMMVTDGGNNRTNWSNVEYDFLLGEANAAHSPAAELEIFQRMEAILMRELPVIPVYFSTSVHLIHPSVRGYHPTLLDIHPAHELSLEP